MSLNGETTTALTIQTDDTSPIAPTPANSDQTGTPLACKAATTIPPATMKAALSTLTAAMMRARSAGAENA